MPARRTSNRMKVLKGTDQPHVMRPEPEYPVVDGYPEPPDWLIDSEAVDEWGRKIRVLSDAKVITRPALEMLAQWCNMHAATVRIWQSGETPNAAHMTQLRLMATEFGFTPASRSKAGPVVKPDSDTDRRARLVR